MSDRNMEVVSGRCTPVLSRALLGHTLELNLDYVDLILAAPSAGFQVEALPQKVLDALAATDAAARRALASCPYTLFSLAFDDTRFWNAALEGLPDESHELTERYGAVSASPMHSAFCEVALFFAWHVAQTHPVAARVLFAMPDAVAARLLDAPLWRIRRVAIDYPGLLTPRWTRNPVFWPDLIRLASSADARLEAAQLHGSQLIACELDGSLPPAARSPAGLRRRRQPP